MGQIGGAFMQPRSMVSMVGTMPQLGPLPGVQMRIGPSSMQQQFQPAYAPQGQNLWMPQAGVGQQQQQQQTQRLQQSMGGPEINEVSDGAGAGAGSYAQIHTPQGGGKRRGKPPNGGRRMKGSPNGGNKGSPQQRVIRPRQQRQRGGLKPVRGQTNQRW